MKSCLPFIALAAIVAGALPGQTQQQPPTLEQVMERLARLENENRQLREEVQGLRDEVAALKPAAAVQQKLEERVQGREKKLDAGTLEADGTSEVAMRMQYVAWKRYMAAA